MRHLHALFSIANSTDVTSWPSSTNWAALLRMWRESNSYDSTVGLTVPVSKMCRETDSNQSTPRSMSASTASSPRRWSSQQSLDLRPHSADSRKFSVPAQRPLGLQRPSDTGSGAVLHPAAPCGTGFIDLCLVDCMLASQVWWQRWAQAAEGRTIRSISQVVSNTFPCLTSRQHTMVGGSGGHFKVMHIVRQWVEFSSMLWLICWQPELPASPGQFEFHPLHTRVTIQNAFPSV